MKGARKRFEDRLRAHVDFYIEKIRPLSDEDYALYRAAAPDEYTLAVWDLCRAIDCGRVFTSNWIARRVKEMLREEKNNAERTAEADEDQ